MSSKQMQVTLTLFRLFVCWRRWTIPRVNEQSRTLTNESRRATYGKPCCHGFIHIRINTYTCIHGCSYIECMDFAVKRQVNVTQNISVSSALCINFSLFFPLPYCKPLEMTLSSFLLTLPYFRLGLPKFGMNLPNFEMQMIFPIDKDRYRSTIISVALRHGGTRIDFPMEPLTFFYSIDDSQSVCRKPWKRNGDMLRESRVLSDTELIRKLLFFWNKLTLSVVIHWDVVRDWDVLLTKHPYPLFHFD